MLQNYFSNNKYCGQDFAKVGQPSVYRSGLWML